jgi:hypothetical protein
MQPDLRNAPLLLYTIHSIHVQSTMYMKPKQVISRAFGKGPKPWIHFIRLNKIVKKFSTAMYRVRVGSYELGAGGLPTARQLPIL